LVKILFACNSFPPAIGGAEKVCKDIVDSLVEKFGRQSVVVLTQPCKNREFSDTILFAEFTAKTAYSYMPELNNFLNKHSFDLYISFGYGKYFTDAIGKFCKKNNKKSIFMPCGDFHTNKEDIKKILYEKLYGKKSFNNYNRIITATKWEKEHWVKKYKINSDKIDVLPYELEKDFNKFKEDKLIEDKDYILYIGRSGPNKLIDLLIKAYNIILPEEKLIIAGIGTDKKKYKDMAETKNIQFLGQVTNDQKKTLIKNAKVCVFPSSFESYGIIILECAALGTPVLVSNIGPFKELVKNEEFIFENTEESLVKCLLSFLCRKENPKLELNIQRLTIKKLPEMITWWLQK
jgi:glycosyltransferase involved in cell wall biosynthesis